MQTINLQKGEALKLVLGGEVVFTLVCTWEEDEGFTLLATTPGDKVAYIGGQTTELAEFGEFTETEQYMDEEDRVVGGAANVVRIAPLSL